MNAEELCREGDSLMERKQYKAAFERYQASADGGCGWGMRHLAECYDNGCGTDISKAQAREWYRRAAEQHIADSWDRFQWLEQNPEFVKMVDGEPYNPQDATLDGKRRACRWILREFNATGGNAGVLHSLLKMDASARIAAPFFCDYGENVLIGANSSIAQDCLILDSAPVYIGNDVSIAQRVHIYTATHPLKVCERVGGPGFSKPVHIGHGVHIECDAVICPGVNIGDGAVISAGAVVRQDVPANHCAQGNPATVQPL